QLKLAQLQRSLPDASGIVRATVNGRIADVHLETGSVVAAGAPLVETLAANSMVVQLGVAREIAAQLAAGQAITIQPVDAGTVQKVNATILMIGAAIDSSSRLVNVIVEPPA